MQLTDYTQGLAWTKINHLACTAIPAPVSAAEPLLQVEVTMGNNSNEVPDYSIIIKQTPIEQDLETK